MITGALLLDRDLSLRQGKRELPPARPGEVVVAVEWAGVCGRDLHALRTGDSVAYWPATLGHEVVGTVESCPGGELPAGRRVVVDPRVSCGARALLGEAQPGGFAGHLVVAADRVVACPDGIEAALAVLGAPLAAATHAAARVPGPPGRAAIVGYDPAGALAHLEITRRWPDTEVTVVEPEPARRELAEALGAVVASAEELAARPDGRRPRLVVDTAGYPGALGLCADGGTVITPACFSGELADALAALAFDPERYRPLVTESVLLDEAPERLRELAAAPSAGKVLIRP